MKRQDKIKPMMKVFIFVPTILCGVYLMKIAAQVPSAIAFVNQGFVISRTLKVNGRQKPMRTFVRISRLVTAATDSDDPPVQVDVSDLGLTMDDLNAPLPSDFFQISESSGYESTSRFPDDKDEGCKWTETPERIKVSLTIPGIRGQPSLCLSSLTATNTLSVTAFGRVVWSCILRGTVKPETAQFEANDGPGMLPVITYQVEKASPGERWSGFILQIGEDSLL